MCRQYRLSLSTISKPQIWVVIQPLSLLSTTIWINFPSPSTNQQFLRKSSSISSWLTHIVLPMTIPNNEVECSRKVLSTQRLSWPSLPEGLCVMSMCVTASADMFGGAGSAVYWLKSRVMLAMLIPLRARKPTPWSARTRSELSESFLFCFGRSDLCKQRFETNWWR